MAIIYIAVDEKLGRDIAVKILKDRYENNGEIRLRFQHEAQAISNFDHPNILKIYDFSGEDSQKLWIITELIHGRNLAEILATTAGGWLHPIIAASIVREICRALSTAHDHGIVHRDVKPENIMITHQGTVKLMDFGIAKIQRLSSMTQTGIFMGSPSYMSPEQVRGRDIDHRSDIYSLGVLFYELATGKLPFTGASTADIAMRILSGEYVHPKFIMAGIPPVIESCIVQCLELLPDNRFQTIADIGVVIEEFMASLNLDQSHVELERCFKNPKAYGERLSAQFKTSSFKPADTVIIKSTSINTRSSFTSPIPRPDIGGGDFSQGSPRKQHLLDPRHSPHVSKQGPSVELIEAHLPNRRQQQRNIKTQFLTPSMSNSHEYDDSKNRSNRHQKNFSKMNQKKSPNINLENRHMQSSSRVIPAVPRRAVRQMRYIFFNNNQYARKSSFLLKLVAAVIVFICFGLFFPASLKNGKSKLGTFPTKIKNAVTSHDSGPGKSATNSQKSEPKREEPISTTVVPPLVSTASDSSQPTGETPTSRTSKKPPIAPIPKKVPAQEPVSSTKSKSVAIAQKNTSKIAPPPTNDVKIAWPVSEPIVTPTEDVEPTSQESIPVLTPKVVKSPPKERPVAAPTKSSISITSSPASEIYIDNTRFGTTNAQGSSSGWIDVPTGQHKLELKRAGFITITEKISVSAKDPKTFGPYILVRGEPTSTSSQTPYRLTLACNAPPVSVSILNLDSRKIQSFTMKTPSQVLTLEPGVYEVTMDRKGDSRKRRIDFKGAAHQLTFSVEFRISGD